MPEKRLVRIRDKGPVQMEERLFPTAAEEKERARLNAAVTADSLYKGASQHGAKKTKRPARKRAT